MRSSIRREIIPCGASRPENKQMLDLAMLRHKWENALIYGVRVL